MMAHPHHTSYGEVYKCEYDLNYSLLLLVQRFSLLEKLTFLWQLLPWMHLFFQ